MTVSPLSSSVGSASVGGGSVCSSVVIENRARSLEVLKGDKQTSIKRTLSGIGS